MRGFILLGTNQEMSSTNFMAKLILKCLRKDKINVFSLTQTNVTIRL